jgi:secondary thiamine-phosphate synthase enzyme
MISLDHVAVLSKKPVELVKITDDVRSSAMKAGIRTGLAVVMTSHTTTGITVNENLECLEHDILATLDQLVPDNGTYVHAHWLPTYGRMSANATGHLKSMLVGNHCVFPVRDGQILLGAAQDIYLCEFDGPQERIISIEIMGE